MTTARCTALLLPVLAKLATPAHAQNYPDRAIKLIVPLSVVSITDTATRLVAQELQARLGQPVVALNQPGASMALGGAECAKIGARRLYDLRGQPGHHVVRSVARCNLPYDPGKSPSPASSTKAHSASARHHALLLCH